MSGGRKLLTQVRATNVTDTPPKLCGNLLYRLIRNVVRVFDAGSIEG